MVHGPFNLRLAPQPMLQPSLRPKQPLSPHPKKLKPDEGKKRGMLKVREMIRVHDEARSKWKWISPNAFLIKTLLRYASFGAVIFLRPVGYRLRQS
jgi:hypothetical protein